MLIAAIEHTAVVLCLVCATLARANPTTTAGQGSTQFLMVPGGRIAFDDSGGADPLVIAVPGMGDVRAEYRYLAPCLTKAGFRVVTMDVRGFGETSAIWPVLSRAMMAVAFAGPWRISAWGAYWNSLFTLQRPPDHAAYKAALVENLREPGRMNALHQMVTLSKADTAALLDRTQVPVLLVVGTKDPDFDDPARDGNALAARLGGSIMFADGVGHYPQVEMSEAVATRMIGFMRHVVTPRSSDRGK